MRVVAALAALLVVTGTAALAQAPVCGYSIVNTYPHDTTAFTQGLVYWQNDQLFEGTGLYDESKLRRVDLLTGEVLQNLDLPGSFFGEGICLKGDQIVQITFQENTAWFRDRDTFAVEETFSYTGQGWGITYDGQRLIMSNGSTFLTFRDPFDFSVLGEVQVRDGGDPQDNLNELEYIRGEVWANVWLTDWILTIDPASGDVIARIDMSGLDRCNSGADVLNGIAWDEATDRLFVTGKRWGCLYEIDLVGCPTLGQIFADGFESGDASQWSALVTG